MRPSRQFGRLGWLLMTGLASVGGAVGQGQSQPAGDVEKGKAVFEKCAACHSLDDTASDGPSLSGVFGRKAGAREDYRYSAAMVRSGIVWDESTLDAFVADPQALVKGNRMSFAGIAEKADRADLIAYLRQATKPAAR